MKILLDTCVWGGVKTKLQESGNDVIWSGDWESDPGDDEILEFAYKENRVLITLDKDFGELAIRQGKPHSGIVRLVNYSARDQRHVCLYVITRYEEELKNGAIITAERGRIRIRLADKI